MYALYAGQHTYAVAYITPNGAKLMSEATEASGMSDTSIRVTHELADELHDRKDRGDSYEDVIWRLVEQADAEGESDA
jgi:hypothetical protein